MATCGTTAAGLLLDKLDRESEEQPSTVHVDTELILRGSSGRLLAAVAHPAR